MILLIVSAVYAASSFVRLKDEGSHNPILDTDIEFGKEESFVE